MSKERNIQRNILSPAGQRITQNNSSNAGKKKYREFKPKNLENYFSSKDFKQLPVALKATWVLKNQAHINDPDLIESQTGIEYFDFLFKLTIVAARRHIEINDTQTEDDSTYSSGSNTP